MTTETPQPFYYIRTCYNVPAEVGREVMFGNRKGVIVEDQGNYIGVNFYDRQAGVVETLHPTSDVQYLDTFAKPRKLTKSQEKYRLYLRADSGLSFIEWLKYVYPIYYK